MPGFRVQTLVLPNAAAAVCIAERDESGSVIAAGLRELARQIESLSGRELLTHPAATVIHELNGFYFIESYNCFITPCDIGTGDKHTVVEIGNTIEEAREVLQRDNGILSGGLVACDDWEVAFAFAIRSVRQSKSL